MTTNTKQNTMTQTMTQSTINQATLNQIFQAVEFMEEYKYITTNPMLLMDCPLRGENKDRELIEAAVVATLLESGIEFDAEVDFEMYLNSAPCPGIVMGDEIDEDIATQTESEGLDEQQEELDEPDEDIDENRIYIMKCPNNHTFHYPFKTFLETGEINCPHCSKDEDSSKLIITGIAD